MVAWTTRLAALGEVFDDRLIGPQDVRGFTSTEVVYENHRAVLSTRTLDEVPGGLWH